jgi:hypothetical protein
VAVAGWDGAGQYCRHTTLARCTCQVPHNSGLPCPDQLAVLCATNAEQIPINMLNPFFRYGSVAEQEAAAAVLEAARNMRKASGSARGWDKKGKKGVSSAAVTGEEEAVEKVERVERYANLMHEAKTLASLGESNMEAYGLMLQGIKALDKEVHTQVAVPAPKKRKAAKPKSGTQAPTPPASSGAGAGTMDTEEIRVENPLKPAKTKGKLKVKRHKRNTSN